MSGYNESKTARNSSSVTVSPPWPDTGRIPTAVMASAVRIGAQEGGPKDRGGAADAGDTRPGRVAVGRRALAEAREHQGATIAAVPDRADPREVARHAVGDALARHRPQRALEVRPVPDAETIGRAAAHACLLYTSDAADDLLCVDLGGRRIIK